MSWFKRHYNKISAKKHGWHPSWFAPYLSDFDNELQDEIVKFQVEHNLKPDGLVGPITFRRLVADRELQLEDKKSENYILIDGQPVPIGWDVEIDLIKPGAYKKYSKTRKPKMIVTHWDACTSASSCKRVLEARDISTHFCIDNDGVIYQYLDTNDIGWHAGKVNSYSIGVDFSNAYYTKYNSIYKKRGFGERPVLKDSIVHGVKLKPHLGYYPVQIEAYKYLIRTLARHYKIPLIVPMTADGSLLKKVDPGAAKGRFKGIVCHYHLTRGKIDCAGLELKKIIDSLY
tara:strand:- start:1365 stop:2225 length:861 start_codon:yes stop_codon:yes gene_type:complete